MVGTPTITVFVRAGDTTCEAALRYLDEHGHSYTTRDITTDAAAGAVLFGRIGRVSVPVIQVGERMIVGYDPVQLARLLPRLGDEDPPVSFGAAVRAVTVEVARARGLRATYGVEVGRVTDNSPAANAGIQAGDLIIAVGAYTVTGGAEQFRLAVAARRPGDRMPITVWRAGLSQALTVSFPMGTQAQADGSAAQTEPGTSTDR